MCGQHRHSPHASDTAHLEVYNLIPMPKTFGEINKDLEVAHRKLSATSEPKQRRAILLEMRKLLEQADDLVQELQREIPSK